MRDAIKRWCAGQLRSSKTRRPVVLLLLVLAALLFVLGIFTVKILWLAALVLGSVWLISKLVQRRAIRS
jgi:hypothetical protein